MLDGNSALKQPETYEFESDCMELVYELRSLLGQRRRSMTSVPFERIVNLMASPKLTRQGFKGFDLFQEHSYTRNMILEDENCSILLLCWKSGQASPIHNHCGSECFVRVIQGVATEIVFESTGCGKLAPTNVKRLKQAESCFSYDQDRHVIANLESEELITLHAYSPPLTNMQVFGLEQTIFAPATLNAALSKEHQNEKVWDELGRERI